MVLGIFFFGVLQTERKQPEPDNPEVCQYTTGS